MLYLWKYDSKLLERRLKAGHLAEKEPSQKIIIFLTESCFLALLVVSVLDHRFGWSHPELFFVILGNVLAFFGFLLIFFVFKENSFTSATIEIADDQKVVSTGPYSIVRHPFYAGALIRGLGAPLALGSYWGLLVVIGFLLMIVLRIITEERFLTKQLPGYTEYKQKVRWRLIPWIW